MNSLLIHEAGANSSSTERCQPPRQQPQPFPKKCVWDPSDRWPPEISKFSNGVALILNGREGWTFFPQGLGLLQVFPPGAFPPVPHNPSNRFLRIGSGIKPQLFKGVLTVCEVLSRQSKDYVLYKNQG